MSHDSSANKPPSRLRNIWINLLILALLIVMVRSILGWSESDEQVIYSNFKCSCKIMLPGNWVQARPSADPSLAGFEIFYFQSAPLLSARSIRIFHDRIGADVEGRVEPWVSDLLSAQQVQDVIPAEEFRFGSQGLDGQSLRFARAGRQFQLVYFYEGENVYAIEMSARNDPAEDDVLLGILDTFEVIR